MGRARRVYRRSRRKLCWAARSTANRFTGRRAVHFLHVGKTGGSAVTAALKANPPPEVDFRTRGHYVCLADIPRRDYVVFFLRDPLSRFVSGFESRRRQGKPLYNKPWSAGEKMAFERFPTADRLASALYQDPHAAQAMRAIGHVNRTYADWFREPSYLESRRDSLFFIGFQETLAEDFAQLCFKLNVTAELPTDPVTAHRNPEQADPLSREAVENLRRWYADDFDLYEAARKLAPDVNYRPMG